MNRNNEPKTLQGGLLITTSLLIDTQVNNNMKIPKEPTIYPIENTSKNTSKNRSKNIPKIHQTIHQKIHQKIQDKTTWVEHQIQIK